MVFVGDDWAEDHHDVELVDASGRRLARARLPEGMEGITRLRALIAQHMPPELAELEPVEAAARVKVGIETERGRWVRALIAAGYQVFAINPMSVALTVWVPKMSSMRCDLRLSDTADNR
jgi:transposase